MDWSTVTRFVGGAVFLVWLSTVIYTRKRARDEARRLDIYRYSDHLHFFLSFKEMRSYRGQVVLEVRRTDDGQWETRFDLETLSREQQSLHAKMAKAEENGGTFFDYNNDYEPLFGCRFRAYSDWRAGGFDKDKSPWAAVPPARQWHPAPEDQAPAIETAYQRYIHSAK